MTLRPNRAFHKVRYLAPVLSVLIASATGCGAVGGDETVGLASIKSAQVNISHNTGTANAFFVAEITLPGGSSCPPPLAADFAITVNGTPMQLSLPDYSDAFTLRCTIHELEGRATLAETDGPLHVELTQGWRKASVVIARSAFPAIGPAAVSRTAVPVGESFSVDIAVSGADVSERQQLASGGWIASLCYPSSGCVQGEGWLAMPPTNAGSREGGLGFDVLVSDKVAKGRWLLGLHLFQGMFQPTITECSGLPSCMAYNHAEQTFDFGPFDLEVL